MASNFLKRKAEERAKKQDKINGKGKYGGTEWRNNQSDSAANSKADTSKVTGVGAGAGAAVAGAIAGVANNASPTNKTQKGKTTLPDLSKIEYDNTELATLTPDGQITTTKETKQSMPKLGVGDPRNNNKETTYDQYGMYYDEDGKPLGKVALDTTIKLKNGITGVEKEWKISAKAAEAFKRDGSFDNYSWTSGEERKAIESINKFPIVPLVSADGTDFGYVSLDAARHINNGTLDKYKPATSMEEYALDSFKTHISENALRQSPVGKIILGQRAEKKLGKFGEGNIDLSQTSVSWKDFTSIEDNGDVVLVPTTVRGKGGTVKLSKEEAAARYRQTGKYFGKFGNYNQANNYASMLKDYETFRSGSKYKSTAKENVHTVEPGLAPNWMSSLTSTFSPSGSGSSGASRYYSDTGFSDVYHDYVNKNPLAVERVDVNANTDGTSFWGYDKSYIKEMTEDEVKIYNFLYNNYGQEEAKKYIDGIVKTLTSRQRKTNEEGMAEYARKNPVSSSAFSVLKSPLKVASYIGQVVDYADDGEIDQNMAYNRFSYENTATREAVSEDMNAVGKFFYNSGMSLADSVYQAALGGGNQFVSLGLMGMGAASDTVIEAKDRGLSDDQAFWLGQAAGASEIITEKIGFGALFDSDIAKEGIKKYVLKNAVTGGLEEVLADELNLMADTFIAGDKSRFNEAINKYMAEGKSKGQAMGLFFVDQLLEKALSFAGGAMSSGIMASGNGYLSSRKISDIGAENASRFNSILQEGLSFRKTSAAYQNAMKLQSKMDLFDAGVIKKSVNNYDIGRQVVLNENQVNLSGQIANENPKSAKFLVELGKIQPENTKAYQLAVKAAGNGGKLSDHDMGTLYIELEKKYYPKDGKSSAVAEDFRSGTWNRKLSRMLYTLDETGARHIGKRKTSFADSVAEPESVNPEDASEIAQTNAEITVNPKLVAENKTPSEVSRETVKQVLVGDVFQDLKTGNTLTVVERNEEQTVIVENNGKTKTTRTFKNSVADRLVSNAQYKQIGGNVAPINSKSAEIEIKDTNSGESRSNVIKQVWSYMGKPISITSGSGKSSSGTVQSLTQNGVNVVDADGVTHSIPFENIAFADTGFTYVDSDGSTGMVEFVSNEAETEAENAKAERDKNSGDSKELLLIEEIATALGDTLKPKALDNLAKAYKRAGQQFNIEVFVRDLIDTYRANGDLDVYAQFFEDGGAKVVEVIEGAFSTDVDDVSESSYEPDFGIEDVMEWIKPKKTDSTDKSQVVVMKEGQSYSSEDYPDAIFVREGFEDGVAEDDADAEIDETRSQDGNDEIRMSISDVVNRTDDGRRASLASDDTIFTYAPTFYSQMGKVIDELKQDKIGANDVISYLTGRGVKAEEIKWSGIETFLEGKKSVTKAELQEFVAGSQLQIEVQERGETIKYTEEQKRKLDRIETDKNYYWDGVYDLWDEILPNADIFDYMATDNTVTMLSRIANAVKKSEKANTQEADRLLGYLDEIESLDHEMQIIVHQAKASGQGTTQWEQYKLNGGENYREIIFKMPNSDYSNPAMKAHWGNEAQGILAHARVQNMTTDDGKKMLFIEEIQSDWHNQGHKEGYSTDSRVKKAQQLYKQIDKALHDFDNPNHMQEAAEMRDEYNKLKAELESEGKSVLATPDAPFRSNYYEYVLKSLIRMAAEQGYDSIGWTTADIQSKRWSDDYAEGYRIEYDQDIPKFLNKYGKKWGAKVGKMEIGKEDGGWYKVEGTTVWTMDITDSMKDSVLYKGQTLYSFESEENANGRNDILYDNSGRRNNESADEQSGQVQEAQFGNRGKSEGERQKTARKLITEGKTQKEIVTGESNGKKARVRFNVIDPTAYDADMQEIVDSYKAIGIDVRLFAGSGEVAFATGENFTVDGLEVNGSEIYLRYDGKHAPQVLRLHEVVHINWNSEDVQNVKNYILDSLSEEEMNNILASERYQKYAQLYGSDIDSIKQEFVADVMAGMSEYSERFSDVVQNYWNNHSEFIDSYKVSEYTESIDAGGDGSLKSGNKVYDNWVDETLDDRDKAILESALHEITYVKRVEYQRGRNGEYIIATPNKLIYTDGNYETPSVYKIIEFNLDNETNIDLARRKIYDAEKGDDPGYGSALRTIENAFGYGSANIITGTNYRTNARAKRTGQGKNGREVNTSRSKASRKREYNKRLREASRKGLKEIQKVIKNEPKFSFAGENANIPSGMYETMEKHFGTTKNFNVAGYLLVDGKVLDFSGKHWGDTKATFRQVDHRDIQEVLEDADSGVSAMVNMIGNGNIRLMPETGGINLAMMPNAEQASVLRDYINHFNGEVVVDVDAVGGDVIETFEYSKGTSASKILSDLDSYFNKGEIPSRTKSSIAEFRYSVSNDSSEGKTDERFDLKKEAIVSFETQERLQNIAKEIGFHDELIETAKQNKQEFVKEVKKNKSLQNRLNNAKRQMQLSPKAMIDPRKLKVIISDVLKETSSTLKPAEVKDAVAAVYDEYFSNIKKAGKVESKIQYANELMTAQLAEIAIDIVDSAEVYTDTEQYMEIKDYISNTRIKVPESTKADVDYADFRKRNMGTFNLTEDGLPVDVAYRELCELFPGVFDEKITNSADCLLEMERVLNEIKPIAYNPYEDYMHEAIEHVVYRFVSEADGIAVADKTKAKKLYEKGLRDKEAALYKERTKFEEKISKEKERSEKKVQALQNEIEGLKYTKWWEGKLSTEEKRNAVKEIREKQKIATLTSKIRSIVSDMKKNLDKNEKTGGYPRELVKSAAEVCSIIDFRTGVTKKDGSPTAKTLRLDELKAEYEALRTNINYDFQSEYSEELSKKIEDLRKVVDGKRVNELNSTELENLKDILSEIQYRLSKAQNQIGIKNAKENAKENAEIGKQVISDIEGSKSIILKNIRSLLLNPHRVNEMIAGYDQNSEWWQLYSQILKGSRKTAKFAMDATRPFDELTSGNGGNELAFFDFRTKLIDTGIKYTDGTVCKLPKSIICEMIMMWDRKTGRRHLENGGATIFDVEEYNKGNTAKAQEKQKLTLPITQKDITRLKSKLDSYDLQWIQRAQYLFNEQSKKAINETSMVLLGREVAKDPNYIRAYVNKDFAGGEIIGVKLDATLEGSGSLKSTNPYATSPVVLRGLQHNVFDQIDFVSKYYGLAIPIRNFNKVYKFSYGLGNDKKSVRNALLKKYGTAIRDDVIERMISELQSPRQSESNIITKAYSKIRGKWLGATFWGNVSSMMKQTTSYWTASSLLDESSLAKGLKSYIAHPEKTRKEIGKHTASLYKREQGLSTTELGDRAMAKRLAVPRKRVASFVDKIPVLNLVNKVPDGLRPGNWLQAMDCSVAAALWEACKIQVGKTMEVTDAGYMQAVTDLYDKVIEETQSNYDLLHRPEILKSKNNVTQTISMFQTDNLQQSGVLHNAFNDWFVKKQAYEAKGDGIAKAEYDKARERLVKATKSRIYSMAWMAFVAKPLIAIILRKFKPYFDEEENDITAKSIFEQMLMDAATDMLGVVAPVGSDLVSGVIDAFVNKYDFVSDPAYDTLQNFIEMTSKVYTEFGKEDGDVLKAILKAIPSISNFTGIPAKNIMDWFTSVKGYVGDIKAGDFVHNKGEYAPTKALYKSADIAAAITTGDIELEEKIRQYYENYGEEFDKGSLTRAIKPAYVDMLVDDPNKAYAIKRKLVIDYGYSIDSVDDWVYDMYFEYLGTKSIEGEEANPDGVLKTNFDYAEEIAEAAKKIGIDWSEETVTKKAKSAYKALYKEDSGEALKKALRDELHISETTISMWEEEVEEAKAKAEAEKAAEAESMKSETPIPWDEDSESSSEKSGSGSSNDLYTNTDIAEAIIREDSEHEEKAREYFKENGKTVNKGSITRKVKPKYVELFVDEPEKAKAIKKKLVVDYSYSSDAVDDWIYNAYMDYLETDVVSARNLKNAAKESGMDWSTDTITKKARTAYKALYKTGDGDVLRKALREDCGISESTIIGWENEVKKNQKKEEEKRQKDLEQY